MGFAAEFLDFMPETVTVTPGYPDVYGTFVESGAVLNLRCRIEGRSRLVRDATGKQVVSTAQVILGSSNGLTVDRHRYTLPANRLPYLKLQAVAVDSDDDENGPCYETVYLP